MPRLSADERGRAIGMFESGMGQEAIAGRLGCSQPAISNLINRYLQSGTVQDRPRTGRPRVTTANQDHYMVLLHLRDRFRTAPRTSWSPQQSNNFPDS